MKMPRRAVPALLVVALAFGGSGCVVEPPRSPNDPGIPEARESAAVRLDDVVARVEFSSDATVLDENRRDTCDFARASWFDTPASEYSCTMSWRQVVVIPHARTRSEIAVALDAEIARMDFALSTSAVRELVMTPPEFAAEAPLLVGGHVGDVSVVFDTEPAASYWYDPVSGLSPAPDSSAGATQVIEVGVSVEYWNEVGLPDLDALDPPTPAFYVWQSAYEDRFLFDLAQPEPADAVDVCLDDAAIAADTVTRRLEPFPRVTFELSDDSRFEDAGRVRDCLAASLTSGTLAWYEPFTGRGTTEVPARETTPEVTAR